MNQGHPLINAKGNPCLDFFKQNRYTGARSAHIKERILWNKVHVGLPRKNLIKYCSNHSIESKLCLKGQKAFICVQALSLISKTQNGSRSRHEHFCPLLISCMNIFIPVLISGMNIFVAFFVLLLLLAESTPSAVKHFPLIG